MAQDFSGPSQRNDLSCMMKSAEPITQPKWESEASAELKGTKAGEVWPLLADFCNMDRWFSNLHTCYQVSGVSGQPGLLRYCESRSSETAINWATERLLMIDETRCCISYDIVENNMGFKSYVATMQVEPTNNPEGGDSCKLKWSFVCDPIEGRTLEDFQSFVEFSLQGIANKMEEHVHLSSA